MGKVHPEISDELRSFIGRQHLFFVGTAPASPEGHLNISPKGLDTLRILGPRTVAYLDLVGSGVETVAHLRENGRITLLFCAFNGRPRIVRLHGRGRVVQPGEAQWDDLVAGFPAQPSARALVVVEVTRVSESCGYGVPLFDYQGERPQLGDWAERKGADGLKRYQAEKNARSIDGLPGLRQADE